MCMQVNTQFDKCINMVLDKYYESKREKVTCSDSVSQKKAAEEVMLTQKLEGLRASHL